MGIAKKKVNYADSADMETGNNVKYNMYFDADKLKLQEYKLVEGINKFDIIPFEITNKMNWAVTNKKGRVGDTAYVLNCWVHRNIGMNRQSVICSYKNQGEKCAACAAKMAAWDVYNESQNEKDKKVATGLSQQQRVLYLIRLVGGENDGEIRYLDISFEKFQKPLNAYASDVEFEEDDPRNNMKRTAGFIDFADIEAGYTVSVKGVKEEKNLSGKDIKFIEPTEIRLTKRKTPLDIDALSDLPSLDEGLVILSYDEVDEMLNGDAPASSKNDDDDDDGTEERIAKRQKPIQDEEDDDRDELPITAPFDTDEDEEAAGKGDTSKFVKEEVEVDCTANTCPYKLKFGEDWDSNKKCELCMEDNKSTYKACMKANG